MFLIFLDNSGKNESNENFDFSDGSGEEYLPESINVIRNSDSEDKSVSSSISG